MVSLCLYFSLFCVSLQIGHDGKQNGHGPALLTTKMLQLPLQRESELSRTGSPGGSWGYGMRYGQKRKGPRWRGRTCACSDPAPSRLSDLSIHSAPVMGGGSGKGILWGGKTHDLGWKKNKVLRKTSAKPQYQRQHAGITKL